MLLALQQHAQLRAARTHPISMKGVPITGSTLQAALKWQCDVSGSGYAIYWTNVNGKLAVAGDYTSEKRKAALRKNNKLESLQLSKYSVKNYKFHTLFSI